MNITRIAATASIALGIAIGIASPAIAQPVMSQSEFPCQEDEVLGYAPQFGPDQIGCIHIEDLQR